MKNLLKFALLLGIVALVLFALVLPVAAAPALDVQLKVTQTNCSSFSTNYTSAWDLGATNPPAAWRSVYIRAEISALTNSLSSSTNAIFALQNSADNSTWTDTGPSIEVRVVGVASTGSSSTNVLIPIPPEVKRYLRIRQSIGAYAVGTTVSTNTYYLVAP